MVCKTCDTLDQNVIWDNRDITVNRFESEAVFSLLILPKSHLSFTDPETSQTLWRAAKEIMKGCLHNNLCHGINLESWESAEGHGGVILIGRKANDKISLKLKKKKTRYLLDNKLTALLKTQPLYTKKSI